MKTLYLHIGTPKTGTTAIQCLCGKNQGLLKEKGYYYPLFPYRYINANKWKNGGFLYGHIKDKDGNRDVQAEQNAYRDCMQHIHEAFEKYDNIILSDEGLWMYGFREEYTVWERIRDQIAEGKFEVKVIVYLRPQEELVYSWWSQRVKERRGVEYTLSWDEMLVQCPTINLDYYDILQKISMYVKKENIIVRQFDRNQFKDGNINSDFLDIMGLEYTDEYKIKKAVQNESLTKNSTEIKRILNLVPGMKREYHRRFRLMLLKNSSKTRDKDIYSMFSEAELKAFREHYQEGNQRIAEEYMGIQENLFPGKKAVAEKWTPENNYMLEDVVAFFGEVIIQMDQQLKEQQKLLTKQQKQIEQMQYIVRHPVKSIGHKVKKTIKR